MYEYPWNKKNFTLAWLGSLYNLFKEVGSSRFILWFLIAKFGNGREILSLSPSFFFKKGCLFFLTFRNSFIIISTWLLANAKYKFLWVYNSLHRYWFMGKTTLGNWFSLLSLFQLISCFTQCTQVVLKASNFWSSS